MLRCLYLLAALALPSPATSADRAVITTTDFSTGALSALDLKTNVATNDVLDLHSDAAVRTYQGKVYVLNRLGEDNVTVLDAAALSTPAIQFSTGNGSNPQDIAFASPTKAYISRLAVPRILVANPATGDSLGAIDLTPFADADGVPEAANLAVYGGRLFVACQRLANFAPTDTSLVAVIDTATDQVVDLDAAQPGVQGIVLKKRNPFTAEVRGSRWILSCVGSFTDLSDGGLEVVDLAGARTEGALLTETDLGGNVGAVALTSHTEGYVVIGDADFVNGVRPFDLAARTAGPALSGLSGGYVPALGVHDGRLYVSDQGTFTAPASAGLHVFEVGTGAALAGPISVGLPPNSIAFLAKSADFDGDGDIDFTDFVTFATGFGKTSIDPAFNAALDLDDSGTVDFPDFVAFAARFGS